MKTLYRRFAAWAREHDADWSPEDVLVPALVGTLIAAAVWALGLGN